MRSETRVVWTAFELLRIERLIQNLSTLGNKCKFVKVFNVDTVLYNIDGFV